MSGVRGQRDASRVPLLPIAEKPGWRDKKARTGQGHENRIDPDAWRPLIMSFCQFYGVGSRVHSSRLAEIPESAYRPQPRAA